jgi:putative PEP-CTERM system TPR-repeat lipoprotein
LLDSAQEDVDAALELMPREPLIAYLQAVIHARAGHPKQARVALERARELSDGVDDSEILGHGPSLLLAAAVSHLSDDKSKARAYLEAYQRLDPGHGGVRKRLGDLLLEQGQLGKASLILESALDYDPDDPQLLILVGRAHMAQGDYQDAAKKFEQALTRVSENEELLLDLARSHLDAGQMDAAVETLERAIRSDVDSIRARLMLGNLWLEKRKPEQARELAQQVLERSPENLGALNMLGVAEMLGGKLEQARSTLERVRASAPHNLPAQLNLARLDALQGDSGAAVAAATLVLQNNPDNLAVLATLAQLEQQRGDLDAAIRWRDEIRKNHPRAVKELLELVDLYLQTGRTEQARHLAELLQASFPVHLGVLAAMARCEMAGGEREIALNTLRLMSTHASYDSERLLEIASLQRQAGDDERAYWSLSKAVQGDPGNLDARFELGVVELRLGRLERIRERVQGLKEEFPRRAEGYVLDGELHLHDGDFSGAEQAYRRALELTPTSAVVARLYRAQSMGGRLDAGRKTLETWLETHPDDLAIDRLLASAMARSGRLYDARARYERLLEDSPEDPAILNDLALIYLLQGDGRALETAQKAQRLVPEDPRVADTLGWVLVKSAQPEEGLRYLREAESRLSHNPEIRYHIAVSLAEMGRDAEARQSLKELLQAKEPFEGREEAERLLVELEKK